MTSATRSPGTDVIAEADTWYPQRSGLRYSFVATVEVVDSKSGRQVVSETANLSRSGCHVRTGTPFRPGTIVKLTARAKGTTFHSEGKVIYSISNEGMGIRFDNIASAEQIILNKWLMQASSEAHEGQLRASRKASASRKQKKIAFALCVLVLAAVVAGVFAWLGVLP
jgi:PilZ domain